MIVDSSVLIAILQSEPGFETYASAISSSRRKRISAATYAEVGIVAVQKRGPAGLTVIRDMVAQMGLEIVSLDAEQAETAQDTFIRYGKGRHTAQLNFGDCFAYALAKTESASLLFKGEDFAKTDIAAVKT
jgi:ribonuclease VapC